MRQLQITTTLRYWSLFIRLGHIYKWIVSAVGEAWETLAYVSSHGDGFRVLGGQPSMYMAFDLAISPLGF